MTKTLHEVSVGVNRIGMLSLMHVALGIQNSVCHIAAVLRSLQINCVRLRQRFIGPNRGGIARSQKPPAGFVFDRRRDHLLPWFMLDNSLDVDGFSAATACLQVFTGVSANAVVKLAERANRVQE